ncbi:MAG: nucleotidyltransferase [Lutisporaceae bacterium]
MNTIAIISEYNPFHKGHKYHIEAVKEQFDADNIVCIMSGSFVQRGEPAMFDKWSRAKMALYGGADLVIELPFVYSCQPAELFAFGAVNILNNLGIIDGICFGSEIGETAILKSIAELLLNEPEDFSSLVKQYLKLGTTYPRSVSLALEDYYSENAHVDSHILENPNNILGIEYIKSIIQLKSPMIPYTIKRVENNYNDEELTDEIASATAVRNEVKGFGLSEKLKLSLPQTSYDIIQQDTLKGKAPVYLNSLSDVLLYRIRTMKTEQLQEYISHKEGIEFRIKKAADQATCVEELIENIKTKRYTRAFIQRLLCHILLDLKWEDSKAFKQPGIPSYTRVLGFNDKGKQLLRSINNVSQFPVINKVADFKVNNPLLNKMFDYDLRASDIYNLARPGNSYKRAGEDYLSSPIYI